MANNHIKMLESSLRNVLASALSARKRLTAARREHGIRDPQMFYTRDEVDDLRAEHRAERLAIIGAYSAYFNPPKDSAFARMAKLATQKQAAEERANLSWIATLARADEILEEQQRDESAKTTADAIHRAAAKARPPRSQR